jgi:hypothetical protein
MGDAFDDLADCYEIASEEYLLDGKRIGVFGGVATVSFSDNGPIFSVSDAGELFSLRFTKAAFSADTMLAKECTGEEKKPVSAKLFKAR